MQLLVFCRDEVKGQLFKRPNQVVEIADKRKTKIMSQKRNVLIADP